MYKSILFPIYHLDFLHQILKQQRYICNIEMNEISFGVFPYRIPVQSTMPKTAITNDVPPCPIFFFVRNDGWVSSIKVFVETYLKGTYSI